MLRDGLCFLHDKLAAAANTFEGWKKWDDRRKKIQ